ncbi:MAG: GNAT family N-acetyltransferase [Paracoccaceae bacterium]
MQKSDIFKLQLECRTLNVTLTRIARENFDEVIELELEPSQESILPTNVFSIAESTLSDTFHPRAICLDGTVVGFVMYQFGEVGEFDEDECTIWRLMIDRNHQNKGIGKVAMSLVLDEIRSHNRCKLVDIYYDAENTVARKLYAKFGFKEVGHRDNGDIIAERPI